MSNDPQFMLKDFVIKDCAVRSSAHFYFVASFAGRGDGEVKPNEATRVAVHFPCKSPEKRWAFRTIRHVETMYCAVAHGESPHMVGVSDDGQVFALGSGLSDMEQRIPSHRQGPLRGVVRDVIDVAGKVYVIQGSRGICKRTGVNGWESLCTDLPVSNRWEERDEQGFNCAAGTGPDNLYAGGDNGDLWHFDGRTWTEQKLPIDLGRGLHGGFNITAMCCVEAGSVYVACRNGDLYLGHGTAWRQLSGMTIGLIGPAIKDMVVYRGTVWATSGAGLWVVAENGLEPVVLPEGIMPGDILDANDTTLLLAGSRSAAWFDGARWQRIL